MNIKYVNLNIVKILFKIYGFNHTTLIDSIYYDRLDIVTYLISKGINLTYNNDWALKFSIKLKKDEITNTILDEYVLYDDERFKKIFKYNVLNNNVKVIKYILSKRELCKCMHEYCLRWAVHFGYFKLFYLFADLKKADLKHHDNVILRWALERGYLNIVKYILENEDIYFRRNEYLSLKFAAYVGFTELIEYLAFYPGVDVNRIPLNGYTMDFLTTKCRHYMFYDKTILRKTILSFLSTNQFDNSFDRYITTFI